MPYLLNEQSRRERTYRDVNMMHPAVLLYRNIMKLNCAPGWRRDIVAEVSPDGEQGLALWKDILEHWHWFDPKTKKWRDRNKYDVRSMIQIYTLRREDEL